MEWIARRFGLAALTLGWLTVTGATEPNVVAARVEYPGASAEQVERDVAIPLERLLEKLQGVKAVTSRSDEGKLLVEVRFGGSAEKKELARVEKAVQEFKAAAPSPIGTPLLSLEPASLR